MRMRLTQGQLCVGQAQPACCSALLLSCGLQCEAVIQLCPLTLTAGRLCAGQTQPAWCNLSLPSCQLQCDFIQTAPQPQVDFVWGQLTALQQFYEARCGRCCSV